MMWNFFVGLVAVAAGVWMGYTDGYRHGTLETETAVAEAVSEANQKCATEMNKLPDAIHKKMLERGIVCGPKATTRTIQ
jgi:hypothetical protein